MNATEEIIKLIGESDSNQGVSDWLSTGILPLNFAMSGRYDGGIPVGRITEIYGAASCGKTLMATFAMIQTQKKGGMAVLLDYEHAFSIERAESLGLDSSKNWYYRQPDTAEAGFGMIKEICGLMKDKNPEQHLTVVVDSTASMITEAELKAGFDDVNMKTKLSLAVVMSGSLKLLAGIISRSNTTLIFLNQTRDNPGVLFGDKETTPGGNAQKFYASLRVRLRKGGKVKDEDGGIIGEEVTAMTVKNKVYRPFVETQYISSFAEGVDLYSTHINALHAMGRLGSTKGWLEMDGKKYRQKELVQLCREDEAMYQRLLEQFTLVLPK
jgi:protein RecA